MIQAMILTNWRNFSKLLVGGTLLFTVACENGGGDAGGDSQDDFATALLCDPTTYDLDCMKSDQTTASDGLLDVLGGIQKEVINVAGGDVTAERQDEYGDQGRQDILQQFPLMEGYPKMELLNGILRKLLKLRENPSEIDYNIFVVRSADVNAFTLGGEVYVTNALLETAESLDELACIIGHEIGHNELGHIANQIKQWEVTENLVGAEIASAIKMATIGFNQQSEAEADLYGIDLALAAGYDACRGIDFWDRMQQREGEVNELDNFFRSHPYSDRRANCYRSHLSALHRLTCEN
jgi:predicted Zn-dependent protease